MKENDKDHYHCRGGIHPEGPCWLLEQFCCEWVGALLDVHLDERVNMPAAIPTIADLDEVTMIAKMNAHPCTQDELDVEDFGNAWYNALGRLLADLAH